MTQRLTLRHGDCVEVLKGYEDGSIGAVVSDPPYGLSFMGKDFDKLGEGAAQRKWHLQWLTEAYRVLRPGGIIKAFSGTRTFHHMAAAMQEAGFVDLRVESWNYGSGFPKSMNIGKALDKAARGVPHGGSDPTSPNHGRYKTQKSEGKRDAHDRGQGFGAGPGSFMREEGERSDRVLTPQAQLWEGWGTALKPSWEPVIVGRKP